MPTNLVYHSPLLEMVDFIAIFILTTYTYIMFYLANTVFLTKRLAYRHKPILKTDKFILFYLNIKT